MAAGSGAGIDRRAARVRRGQRAARDLTLQVSPPALAHTTAPVRVEARGWGIRHAGRRAWALRGVDFTIEPGERVLLLGASGSGKSTLLTALAGLVDPESGATTEGTLLVDGVDPRRARRRAGLVLQDPDAQIVMGRAGDDVAFGLENHCVPTDLIWPRVDAALAAVEFPYGRDRPTHALSGGERQRLALAGVLALHPGLLLLDEPTANLDPNGAGEVRRALALVLETLGPTMVLVEHRVDEALSLVERVIVLGDGGVVADGEPGAVFARRGAALAEAGVWVPGHLPRIEPRPRSRAAEPLLVGRELAYRYPGATSDALVAGDVVVRSSEALAVTGPNGSGKSTLAMLVAGLLRPRAGDVVATAALAPGHGGESPARWSAPELVRRIGTVFQNPEHQFLAATVRDELELGPRATGMPATDAAARATELLGRLRLEHLADANPFTLSGGEKRRLSVGTALATEPAVLVLDEPTFGQDRRTWAELLRLLVSFRDDGGGLCVVSHDAAFVEALADRTVVMREGRTWSS